MSMKIKSTIMSLSALLCLVSPLAFSYGELETETVAGGNQAMVEKDGSVERDLSYGEFKHDRTNSYLCHSFAMNGKEIANREADFLSTVFDDEYKANIISAYFGIHGVRDFGFHSRSQIVEFFDNEREVLVSSLDLNEDEKDVLTNYYELRISQELMKFDRQKRFHERVKQYRSKKGHRKGGRGERDSGEAVSDMKYGETKIIPINQ